MANYEIQPGTLLETFETIGDWTCGGTLIFNSHIFVTPATTTTEFPVADMQALVDYIMKYHYAGVLDMMPVSTWYRGLTNSRRMA